MKKTFFLECECNTEGLKFEKYEDDSLWISLYKLFSIKFTFLERLQLCWRILCQKEVDIWDINLSPDKVKQLKKFLNNVTNH